MKIRPHSSAIVALAIRVALGALLFSGWTRQGRSEEVWLGTASANLSNPLLWLDGSAPPAGGSADLAVRFMNSSGLLITATNDLGDPFVINQLNMESQPAGALILTSAAGNSLQFGGAAPAINISGPGTSQISSRISLAPVSGTVTIVGDGSASLTIPGSITESGGARGLVIDGRGEPLGAQIISLSGNNSFSGGVTLQSGNLMTWTSNSLGSGTVTINGGTFRQSAGVLANEFHLNQDLVLMSGAALSGVISSSTPGTGLTHQGLGTVRLLAASTYTGATTIDSSRIASSAILPAGTISLEDNASLLGSSSFHVRAGGTLAIKPLMTAVTNHLPDTAPVHLRDGTLNFESTGGVLAQSEIVGSVHGAGYSTLNARPSSSNSALLSAQSLNRIEHGTFFFQGKGLGSTLAPNVGQILFDIAPPLVGGGGTGADTSIVPFAIGQPVNVTTVGGIGALGDTSLVTYSSGTGIRPLNLGTEYATTLTAGATKNVRIRSTETVNAPLTINALVLESGIIGTGPVTIASGTVLTRGGGNVFINAPLAFGSVEANFFTVGKLDVHGPISGTGGLTKSGAADLTLLAANSFTGPLTINLGLLRFATIAALGNDSSPIVINGHNAGLSYAAASYSGVSATLTRDIEIGTGVGRLDADNEPMIVSGTISGEGGLHLSGDYPGSIVLAGANTYRGPTVINVPVTISADSAFGNGGALDFRDGNSLTLLGNWTTGRAISLSAPASINTGGFNADLAGVLSGIDLLTKSGAGRLRITTASPFSGGLVVTEGSMELSGSGTTRSSTVTLHGSKLVLENDASASNDRISDVAVIRLNSGEVRLHGNSGANVTETLGAFELPFGNVGNVVTLTAPGAFGTSLRFSGAAVSGSALFRGDNLGGAPGGAFTRVVFATAPAAPNGVIRGVYADNSAIGLGSSFATYDAAVDAAGTIGLRPLRTGEYASGAEIRNPQNGGATPDNANFLVTGATGAGGLVNRVNTVTLDPAAALMLTGTQTLGLSSADVLARAGGPGSTLQGGTIDFGAAAGTFFTAGDLEVTSAITGSAGLRKLGAGALTLNAIPAYSGTTNVLEGALRLGAGNPFARQTITIGPVGRFELNGIPTAVGALAGEGVVELGTSSLTLGTLSTDMEFGGSIRGGGSLRIVDGGDPYAVRKVAGVNTYSGGTVLESGILDLYGASALGSGPLTINGGAFQVTLGFGTIANPIILNADLLLRAGVLTLDAGATVSGAHALRVSGRSRLTIQTAAAHTGETRVEITPAEYYFSSGQIVLTGAAGSALATSRFHIEGDDDPFLSSPPGLILDDSIAFTGGPTGRIGDTTPVNLLGGTLSVIGNATADTVETIGALNATGFPTVNISVSAGGSTRLTAESLNRLNGGTFLFRGANLGSPVGNGVATVRFITPPAGLIGGGGTGANVSILPYAIGHSVPTGNTLVSYDPVTGIRLVTTYVGTLTGAIATNNVRLSNHTTNNAAVTINALVIDGDLNGTGKITIGSGVVLKGAGGTSRVSNEIDFGAAEGQIYVPRTAALELNGVVRGNAGLTKSGLSDLVLNAANEFSGGLRINSGAVTFSSDANLGTAGEPIIIAGRGSSLTYTGTANLSLTRPIELAAGIGTVTKGAFPGTFTLSGPISGPGGLHLSGFGYFSLTGVNTYSGPTLVTAGVAFPSDAALGTGPLVIQSTEGIRLDGPWTTARPIEIVYGSVFTNGFDAVWNGPLLANHRNAILTKEDAGTLTITAPTTYNGPIEIRNGAVRFAGQGASLASAVSGFGNLILDNSVAAVADRLPDTIAITAGGKLSFIGNSGAPTAEGLGPLIVDPGNGPGTIEIIAPGAHPTTLSFASYVPGPGSLVFRGGIPDGFKRVTFRTPPALVAGLLPSAMIETNPAGTGNAFATYDSSVDAQGVIGVRALRLEEYALAPIQNPANGGTTSTTANVLANNAATASGTDNSINSLTFANGGTLALSSSQTLIVGGDILTQAGANAMITGGKLFLNSTPTFRGDGNLSISANLSAPFGFEKRGLGELRLAGSGASGLVELRQGTLRVSTGDALAAASVNISPDAALAIEVPATVSSIRGSGAIRLDADLAITGSGTFDGSITGPGGVLQRGSFSLGETTFTRPLIHSGVTAAIRDPRSSPSEPGTVILTDSATALTTSGFIVGGGSEILINNGFTALNRMNGAPVSLNGGRFTLWGNSNTSISEVAGSLIGTGFSALRVGHSSPGVQLRFTDLQRIDRGTFDFQDVTGSSPGSHTSNVIFGTFPPGNLIGANTSPTNKPVVPFAIHITSFMGLLTYEVNTGLRPLYTLGEYSSTLSSGDNVRLTASATNDATVAINSLVLAGGDVFGAGTLSIASGTILSWGYPVTIGNRIAFGSTEGFLFGLGGGLVMLGEISGTNGLTLSGSVLSPGVNSTLTLSADNTFTGPLTINTTTLQFAAATNLGPDPGTIVINDGGLSYTGTSRLALSRPLRITGYQALVRGNLTLDGGISGSGSLRIGGDVVLSGSNSYSGFTEIGDHGAGTLTISSDAALGNSAGVYLNGGTLKLTGPWNTSRRLGVTHFSTGYLDTSEFNAAVQGPLVGFGSQFRKRGAGTLTLNDPSQYRGSVFVEEGTLAINSPVGGSLALSVSAGGRLTGSFATAGPVVVDGVIAPGSSVGSISAGGLTLRNGATLAFDLAPGLSDQLAISGLVTLEGTVNLSLNLGLFDPEDFVDQFILVTNAGEDSIAGNGRFSFELNRLEEAEVFTVGSQEFLITYLGGTGNDVVLFAVPEPSSAALVAGAWFSLTARRRRIRPFITDAVPEDARSS